MTDDIFLTRILGHLSPAGAPHRPPHAPGPQPTRPEPPRATLREESAR